MKFEGLISGSTSRTGAGGFLAGLLALVFLLPLLIFAIVAAAAIGVFAVLTGLILALVNRVRAAVTAPSSSGRRNVRVIRRE